jgi:hypothetical protein
MKKSIIFLVLVAGILASCSQYTCPTYAKSDRQKKVTAKHNVLFRAGILRPLYT